MHSHDYEQLMGQHNSYRCSELSECVYLWIFPLTERSLKLWNGTWHNRMPNVWRGFVLLSKLIINDGFVCQRIS